MKLTIDEDTCKKSNLSISEMLMILLVKTGVNIKELLKTMKNRQILVEEHTLMGSSLLVTQRWNDVCDSLLLSSDREIPKENDIKELAKTLMDIFPEGKKEGTSQYWKGNIREITLKLQKFFKLYGNKYTNEQIISATKRYVAAKSNSPYMRILKYFICKNEKKVDSEGVNYIEEVSDLATYIENEGQEEKNKEDWEATLI